MNCCLQKNLHNLNAFSGIITRFFSYAASCRSGKQQDVLRWSWMSEAADGGHEIPPAAWASPHVPEPQNKTQKVHRGGTLRCRRDGCYQRCCCVCADSTFTLLFSCFLFYFWYVYGLQPLLHAVHYFNYMYSCFKTCSSIRRLVWLMTFLFFYTF